MRHTNFNSDYSAVMDTMAPLVSCEPFAKQQRLHFMNTMAFLATSFIFCSREIISSISNSIFHFFIFKYFNLLFILIYFSSNLFPLFCRPTSSKAENIKSIYYEAEYHGKLQECHRYVDNCKTGLLDLISHMISIESLKII